jgi:hypothetical protein
MFARLKRWYTIWIVDDRGAERPLVKLRRFRRSELKGWFARRYIGTHAGRLQECVVQNRDGLIGGEISPLVLLLLLALFLTRGLLRTYMPGSGAPLNTQSRWVFEIASAAVMSIYIAAWMRIQQRHQRLLAKQELRSAYLLSSHCPSCDTSLEGLPPEADGCVVCPTCSAAWKASAVGPQTVAEPEVRAILPGTRGELS